MNIFKPIGRYIVKNLPSILSIAGASGLVVTAVLTAKATPKATEIFEEMHKEDEPGKTSVLTVVTAAKPYIPAVTVGAISMACILMANGIHIRRYATLCTTYNLLADEFSIFKRAAVAQMTEDGLAAAAGAVVTAKPPAEEGPELSEDGEILHWFYDVHSMTWFKSTWHDVDNAKMDLNDDFSRMGWVPLTRYYELLELHEVIANPDLGWNISRLIEEYECPFVPFEHSEKIFENGEKGFAIWFPIEPEFDEDY